MEALMRGFLCQVIQSNGQQAQNKGTTGSWPQQSSSVLLGISRERLMGFGLWALAGDCLVLSYVGRGPARLLGRESHSLGSLQWQSGPSSLG